MLFGMLFIVNKIIKYESGFVEKGTLFKSQKKCSRKISLLKQKKHKNRKRKVGWVFLLFFRNINFCFWAKNSQIELSKSHYSHLQDEVNLLSIFPPCLFLKVSNFSLKYSLKVKNDIPTNILSEWPPNFSFPPSRFNITTTRLKSWEIDCNKLKNLTYSKVLFC